MLLSLLFMCNSCLHVLISSFLMTFLCFLLIKKRNLAFLYFLWFRILWRILTHLFFLLKVNYNIAFIQSQSLWFQCIRVKKHDYDRTFFPLIYFNWRRSGTFSILNILEVESIMFKKTCSLTCGNLKITNSYYILKSLKIWLKMCVSFSKHAWH